MTDELDRLEQAVEREMDLLRRLPPVGLRRECLARVQAAVLQEAGRSSRPPRLLGATRAWVGAAAAVLLAVGWATWPPSPARPAGSDPEAVLAEWAAALDESSQRLTNLLDSGWTRGNSGPTRDEETDLDDLFRSLGQSFDRFETL